MSETPPPSVSGAGPARDPDGSAPVSPPPERRETTEERLAELVDRWQEEKERGREIALNELCRDCPELAKEAARRINVLQKMGELAKAPTEYGVEVPAHATANDLTSQSTNMGAAGSRSLQALLKMFTPPQAPEELGRLGDYAILGLLGEGGMGAVFVAEDPMLHRRVALKVMRPEVAAHPKARERFLREARSAAKLQNDHIVPIYHVDHVGSVWFITMPLLQGETLDHRVRRGPPLTVPEIMKVGREVAEGLAAAHAMNLIHRDIKPANLWLEERKETGDSQESGVRKPVGTWDAPGAKSSKPPLRTPESSLLASYFRVKILDFGLARPTVSADEMTGSGTFLGTPGFMSPEQIDALHLDGRTDLFSLGVVLYKLTTGKAPFAGATLTAILRATAERQPPSPCTLNPEVPLAFSQLIMRLLQKKPEARYASAHEVVAAFQALALRANVTLPTYVEAPPSLSDPERCRNENATAARGRNMVFWLVVLVLVFSSWIALLKASPVGDWFRSAWRQWFQSAS